MQVYNAVGRSICNFNNSIYEIRKNMEKRPILGEKSFLHFL